MIPCGKKNISSDDEHSQMAQPRKAFAVDNHFLPSVAGNVLFWDKHDMRPLLRNGRLSYAGLPVLDIVGAYRRKKEKRRQFMMPGDTAEVKPASLHFFVGRSPLGKWALCANVFGPNVRRTYAPGFDAKEPGVLVFQYAGPAMDGCANVFNIGTVSELAPPRAVKPKKGEAAAVASDDDELETTEKTSDEVEADKRKRAEREGNMIEIE